MKLLGRDRAAITALFAVFAWQTGALYFIIQKAAHSTFANPVFVYLPLAMAVVFAIRPRHSAETAQAFGMFAIFWSYLLLSSLWSPSHVYLSQKLMRTAVGLPLFIFAGYVVAAGRATRQMAIFTSLFALSVGATILIFHVPLLELLAFAPDRPLDYQRLSVVAGAGGTLALLTGRSFRARAAGVATFLILAGTAVISGGRAGILLALVGPVIRFRRQLMRPVMLAVPVLIAVLAVSGIAGDIGEEIGSNPNVPKTVQRAVNTTMAITPSLKNYTRADFQQKAWVVFLRQPSFGTGLAGFPISAGLGDDSSRYPHNVILELLAEGGIVGILLAAAMAFICLRRLLGPPIADRHFIWAFFCIGTIIAMVSDDLPAQGFLFMSLGMMMGAPVIDAAENKSRRHLPGVQALPEGDEDECAYSAS